LFESSQTLFWASFGLIDLDSFELTGIQSYTRFWGLLMFGSYCVINVVVLLNLLIAMMNHSYQMISEQADVEWKFARCKLWMSYFEDGATVPPPLNIIPTPKSAYYLLRWFFRKFSLNSRNARKEHLKTIRRREKQACERDFQYQTIMRNLVRRYVTEEQRKADNQGVTEDDVNEIKQDISSFRYELTEILRSSGFNTSASKGQTQSAGGKKGRQKERRLMKGFDIGLVESSIQTTPEVSVDETGTGRSPPGPKLARIAKLATRKAKRGKWSHLVEATKHARAAFSRSRSDESLSSQGSSEHPSRMECSSRNGSSSSSGGGPDNIAEPRPAKSLVDLPVIKRSIFARKFAISTSKLRLAFMDSDKSSSLESHPGGCSKNKVGDSSADRGQAQRTVSAPFSQWLGAKSTSMDHLGKGISSAVSHHHHHHHHQSLSPARSLSPIPSCASSNVPTPRSSITGQHDACSTMDVNSQKGSIPGSPATGADLQEQHQQTTNSSSSKVFVPGSFGIETVNYPPTAGWI
ncbi:transient-receptor-potential-like protein, partial [Stegodyphus dumicola]|uniref:transient-receptor-potential-like protein n=1 Tax=Stegodyphus dumicola TaxID=202533 RepID=UPI0015AD9FC4